MLLLQLANSDSQQTNAECFTLVKAREEVGCPCLGFYFFVWGGLWRALCEEIDDLELVIVLFDLNTLRVLTVYNRY